MSRARPRWSASLLLALSALTGGDLVVAQEAPDPRATILSNLDVGHRARLSTPTVAIGDGIVLDTGPATMTIDDQGQVWTIPFDQVTELHVRRPMILRLALAGAAAGAGVGWLFNRTVPVETCVNPLFCHTSYESTSDGLLLGAAVGTVVGAALGAMVKHWVRRIP